MAAILSRPQCVKRLSNFVCDFVVNSIPADGLAPNGARASEGTVMTVFINRTGFWRVICYIALKEQWLTSLLCWLYGIYTYVYDTKLQQNLERTCLFIDFLLIHSLTCLFTSIPSEFISPVGVLRQLRNTETIQIKSRMPVTSSK